MTIRPFRTSARNDSLRGVTSTCIIVAMLFLTAGCKDRMADQARTEPLERSAFYDDERGSRAPVEGTVARGQLEEDQYDVDRRPPDDPLPIEITAETIRRGQERFNIRCATCHGRAGDGEGIVPARGYTTPTSFHIDRLRDVPLSHFVNVVEKGVGRMPAYAGQVQPRDRWAIALYIRALQISQHADRDLLGDTDLTTLPHEANDQKP